MLSTLITALVVGLIIMGALHIVASAGGISLFNLLLSAVVLGLIVMVILRIVRSL